MPNLISPAGWTTGGPGTVSAGTTLVVNGTSTGTTYARQQVATVPGASYWLTFEALTPTAVPTVLVGTAPGGAEIVPAAPAAAWSNRVAFVAAGDAAWVQVQRQGTGESRANAVSVERVTGTSHPARRCNGVNQYLRLDALAAGLRTANHNFYVGGWIRFDSPSSAGTYLADFGRADASGTGGVGRVRLVASTGTDAKVFCSSGLADGSRYRECFINTAVTVGSWYHVGVSVGTDADVTLTWGGAATGSRTGTVPTLQADTVCRVLQLGAKVWSPPESHAPASYSDWVWCSGFLPTAQQLQALAAGTRPGDLAGFAPSLHWPMAVDGGDEAPLAGTHSLTAAGSPLLAAGPDFAPADATPATPPDIIVV